MQDNCLRQKVKGTLFVLPAFVIHFCLILLPACSMFYYSVTDWNGLSKPNFVGFKNFIKMTKDISFLLASKNNIIYCAIFLVLPLTLGLGLALIFTKIGKVQMVYRTLCFLPYVISPTVAGKIFSVFYSPYSGFGTVFNSLGLTALADFSPLGNQKYALYAVAFVDNWHWWGFVLVLMMSALHQVDTSLYAAANIEGASAWQQFTHVTIPQIKPTLISYLIFDVVASFTTFDWIWIMTQGGPAGATEVFSTRIYKRTFVNYEAGYGSALSLTVCAFALLAYFLLTKYRKREERDL
jgi:raffinose/stachyose/melibiose transport system permease protein